MNMNFRFFSYVVMICISFLFFSCVTDSWHSVEPSSFEKKSNMDETSYNELLESLAYYNDSLYCADTDGATRGRFSWWDNWGHDVVVADGKGAFWGCLKGCFGGGSSMLSSAAIGAVCASVKEGYQHLVDNWLAPHSWPFFREDDDYQYPVGQMQIEHCVGLSKLDYDRADLCIDSIPAPIDSCFASFCCRLGKLHNYSLAIINSEVDTLSISTQLPPFSEDELSILHSSDFTQFLYEIQHGQIDTSASDREKRINAIFNLFSEAIEILEDERDLLKITNDYTRIIKTYPSALTENEQRSVYSAMVVCLYSHEFWKDKE